MEGFNETEMEYYMSMEKEYSVLKCFLRIHSDIQGIIFIACLMLDQLLFCNILTVHFEYASVCFVINEEFVILYHS